MQTPSNYRCDAYEQMMTQLGEFLKSEFTEKDFPKDCSLLGKIDDVKERYTNSAFLAGGGMKMIYKVTDRMTDRAVAMAVMHTLKSPEIIEQFIREARITARLEHPNIMPVYDIGIDEIGEPFFTMKLINGDNLGQILKKIRKGSPGYARKYPLSALLDIFSKVCNAVAYAHSRKILHLDLKPDNIQVGDFGEVLVCDWGLSRYQHLDHSELSSSEKLNPALTSFGTVSGTPGFMSPEQISCERADLDSRSDIYALGAILYNILTLCSPMSKQKSIDNILEMTLKGKLPKPSVIAPKQGIPKPLEAVCLHAMAHRPENRYATAGELKEEIISFIQGFATSAENAGFLRLLQLIFLRYKALFILLTGALCTVVTIVTFFMFELKESERRALLSARKARESLQSYKLEQEKVRQERTKREKLAKRGKEILKNVLKQNSFSNNVKFNPSVWGLWQQQAYLDIAGLKFAKAVESLKRSDAPQAEKYLTIIEPLIQEKRTTVPKHIISELIKLLLKDNLNLIIKEMLSNLSKNMELEQKVKLAVYILYTLNQQLGDSTLKLEDKNGAYSINLSGRKIKEITGLSLLPLARVNLADTLVEDVSSLHALNLTELNLSNSPVASVELSMTNLKKLNLSQTSVTNLENLKAPNLEELLLLNSSISDFSFIKKFPKLKNLTISYSKLNLNKLKEIAIPSSLRVILK